MSQFYQDRIDTPKGVFLVLYSDKGIYELFFPGSKVDQDYPQRSLPWPQFAEDLKSYFLGNEVDWSPYPLDCSGYRRFTDTLLRQVRLIGYGQVCSYREIAGRAGSPLAWRAAGQALSINRHPVIVPCHRVIGSNGKLGGFSGPSGWKLMLLQLEGRQV